MRSNIKLQVSMRKVLKEKRVIIAIVKEVLILNLTQTVQNDFIFTIN
jgi:hypothetical protein